MTPNNSDQAALHDELRARLLAEAASIGVSGVKTSEFRLLLEEAAAALTLPASEAVAWRWRHPDGDAGTWWDAVPRNDDYKRVALDDDCTIEYAYGTPQPAPAAHAGGEAMPVDALREIVRGMDECLLIAAMPPQCGIAPGAVEHWRNELTALLSGGAAREGK